MNKAMIRVAIQSKILWLVKFDMYMRNISEDKAYTNVIKTELFNLLKDESTKLYIEPREFIAEAYEIEVNKSSKDMLEFIAKV